jgi:Ca2+-binding RTX toxin-like protein
MLVVEEEAILSLHTNVRIVPVGSEPTSRFGLNRSELRSDEIEPGRQTMSTMNVTNTAELQLALKAAQAGDAILLAAGTYSGLSISNLNIAGTVSITSQDLSRPAILKPFTISGSSGLNFSNLEFSADGFTGYNSYIVQNSNNIHFKNLDIHGSQNSDLSKSVTTGFFVRNSSDVSIKDSEFQYFKVGISNATSNNVTYSGNNFHNLRTDGINFSGSSYVQVTNNRFTNFSPNMAGGDHPDAIQFWTAGTKASAHDILISGNTISRGTSKVAPQGIFLGDEVGNLPYQKVTISKNTLTGMSYNGIAIARGQNITVDSNTVTPYSDLTSRISILNSATVHLTSNKAGEYILKNNSNLVQSSNSTLSPISPRPATTESNSIISPISYTLGSDSNNLTLSGSADINGTGNSLANTIVGNSANNILKGGAGADLLNGGGGSDTMFGGHHDDTYVVDSLGDVVKENSGEGIDTVRSSISYILPANVENLTLTGTTSITGTGNSLANVIIGNSGNNILAGLHGADVLNGGTGTDKADYSVSASGVNVSLATGRGKGGDAEGDTYISIENATGSKFGDTIEGNSGNNVLAGGTGIDTVSYISATSGVTVRLDTAIAQNTLGAGSDTLSGFENVTGSNHNDILTGSSSANVMIGLGGNDILNGGRGADSMFGGAGNDIYVVETAGDVVTENPAGGTDTVQSWINYTLTANVENLALMGPSGLSGTGNELGNIIAGNSNSNALWGKAGNDTLLGKGGNDQLIGGNGADSMTGGAGADRFIFVRAADFAAGPARDTIMDFNRSQADKIDLSGVDANSLTSTINEAFAFIGTTSFGREEGQLRYQANSGGVAVTGDVNGDGNADFAFNVLGVASLAATDFLL